MRLPTRTTMPPIREASTLRESVTSRPTASFSAALSDVACSSESSCAETTSAEISPRCFATSWRNAAHHLRQREEAPVAGRQAHEVAGDAAGARLVQDRVEGADLVFGRVDGAAHETQEILALDEHLADFVHVRRNLIDGAFLGRQIKQRRGVTTGHAGYESVFSVHPFCSLMRFRT